MNNYKDFEEAEQFKKYKPSQAVPESCCILKDYTQKDGKNLFTPKDDNCISNPTGANSYFDKVNWTCANVLKTVSSFTLIKYQATNNAIDSVIALG